VIRHVWIARRPPGFAFVTYLKAMAAKRAVESVAAMENHRSNIATLRRMAHRCLIIVYPLTRLKS
jgi:hypothetical protein